MSDKKLLEQNVIQLLIDNNITLSTMESCTSGSLCSSLTNVSGSSEVIKGGLITYCNELKVKFGVSEKTIDVFTVYSKECASEMALNARLNCSSDLGIGVTGCLGRLDPFNDGGMINKVFFAISSKNNIKAFEIEVPNLERSFQKEYIIQFIFETLLNDRGV